MATVLFSIPQTALTAGVHAPFVTGAIPAGNSWQIVISPVVWPTTGWVAAIGVEESADSGVTWIARGGTFLPGTPTPTDMSLTFPIQNQGGLVRLTVAILQACTVSGLIQVL